jgi:hypothetical protein
MKLCTISLKQSCREVSIGVTRVELALRRWCQAQSCHKMGVAEVRINIMIS